MLPTPSTPRLPQNAVSLLKLAVPSMFDLYAGTVQGITVADREHRIVWISEGDKSFPPALGIAGESDFVGQRVQQLFVQHHATAPS